MPQLVPLTVEAAIDAIERAGFTPSAVPKDVPNGAAEVGKVIAQSPAAGSRMAQGSTVQLTYGRPTP